MFLCLSSLFWVHLPSLLKKTPFQLTTDKAFCFFLLVPYPYEHTNFHQLQVGDQVNLEFDMIGKYVATLT
ncbi:MAG: hypothetical protein HOI84_01075 [Flavobacteriaceae bacterium]|nr:hypothetical protein [Flavobacteriaceae bacterium]